MTRKDLKYELKSGAHGNHVKQYAMLRSYTVCVKDGSDFGFNLQKDSVDYYVVTDLILMCFEI